MIDSKSKIPKYTSDAFGNVEYELRMTYTLETDSRVMSFVDNFWGFEITGGTDQFEPLTVINVAPLGMARRAGMRVGDEITQINDETALELTFNEAYELFRQSGRHTRVHVRGDDDDQGIDPDLQWTCDYWFKPRKPWRRDFKPIIFDFPWNDRRKPIYKESNCFMVPSVMEEKLRLRRAVTSAVKEKIEKTPHTRSLTPTPRPKNQPGPNLLESTLKPRNLES